MKPLSRFARFTVIAGADWIRPKGSDPRWTYSVMHAGFGKLGRTTAQGGPARVTRSTRACHGGPNEQVALVHMDAENGESRRAQTDKNDEP